MSISQELLQELRSRYLLRDLSRNRLDEVIHCCLTVMIPKLMIEQEEVAKLQNKVASLRQQRSELERGDE